MDIIHNGALYKLSFELNCILYMQRIQYSYTTLVFLAAFNEHSIIIFVFANFLLQVASENLPPLIYEILNRRLEATFIWRQARAITHIIGTT